MSYRFRENLEVDTDGPGDRLRCTACRQQICAFGPQWRNACLKRSFSPTEAGPLMGPLEGGYRFVKLYCPFCNVLLDSAMVEVKNES